MDMQQTPDGVQYDAQSTAPAATGACSKLEITPDGNGAFAVACTYPNSPQPTTKAAASLDELLALVRTEFGGESAAPVGAPSDIETDH